MKKKRIIKRLLSMLLVIAMTTAMLPQTLQASQNVSEASEITANEAEADDTGDTGTEMDESNAANEETVNLEAVDTKLENPIAITSEEDGSGTGDSAHLGSEAAGSGATGSVGNDTNGSNLISGEDVRKVPGLELIADSEAGGPTILKTTDSKYFFALCHLEYDSDTLALEYQRDLEKGLNPHIPCNYFPNDDPSKKPVVNWRSAGQLLFSNWINYYVYQTTPYDIGGHVGK